MDVKFALYSFIALFIIIDPIANIPAFIAVLDHLSEEEQIKTIRKSILIAALILILFTVVGRTLFEALNIEMYSFKIACGILVLIISIEMLFGKTSMTKGTSEEYEEEDVIAVTPLAIPFLSGPGAITTAIVLFDLAGSLLDKILVLGEIILVFLLSYLILSRSKIFYKVLGKSGTKALVRIMGLVLASIAVQFILIGVSEAMKSLV
ncbi:MAG: MarC family protein [Candidatus Hydrothermarchaeota archaeon]